MKDTRFGRYFDGRRKRFVTRIRTQHIGGPKHFDLASDEICGLLMGRNIAYNIPVFMEHYRALGMRYLVYLDNGSDDGSVEIMRRYSDVIILQNRLNFREYQRHMRMHMAREYATGGWRLAVDADEILRYPGDARIDLPELTRRLEARGMTGLLAQMLEMVPDGPLEAFGGLPFNAVLEVFRHFSLGNITAYPYGAPEIPLHPLLSQNSLSDPGLHFLYGGLRRALFSEDCCLSKHVLFRHGSGVTPLPNPHVSTGLHMADFTVLLQHYKFAGGFLARERRRQAERRLSHNETELRLAAFARNPQMTLTVPDMGSDPTPASLLEAGFLQATKDACRMLAL